MKKALKMIVIIALTILLLLSLTSIMAKHGWRLWGFKKCENPNGIIYTTNVYVTDEFISMQGGIGSSALKYNGYTYKFIDKTLYVGVRYGLFEGDGADFYFKIDGNFSDLENVVLTNDLEERCVWNLHKDKKYMKKINKVRLYETVSVSNEIDYKEQMKYAEFVYADAELLNRIQHPTFSDELYFTKGSGYLGVAELENGEELYLDFARHFNFYDIIGVFGHYDY
ncbi:MAG: hypothetical protein IJW15_04975 [Clostridia bacterium]|nr:hypothetical protein [Clostridia bacterium]